MWWYNIIGYNQGIISHILQLDNITEGSMLLNVKPVALKRVTYEPILIVNRTKWRNLIDYFGQSIEADPSKVGKKKIYIFPYWIYTKTFICKLHISRQHLVKYFKSNHEYICLYQLTKNLADDIAPHISSALRDLHLGKLFLLFSQALIQKDTVASWHLHYHTFLNNLFGLGCIQIFFHGIIFSYSSTATRTLTFGYIKCTPDVAFTVSFLDIVFGQYFRQEMGKNCLNKCGMSLSSHIFAWKYRPWCHVCCMKNERLECKIKVSLRCHSAFYRHHTQRLYQKLQYPELFLTRCRCDFYKSIYLEVTNWRIQTLQVL